MFADHRPSRFTLKAAALTAVALVALNSSVSSGQKAQGQIEETALDARAKELLDTFSQARSKEDRALPMLVIFSDVVTLSCAQRTPKPPLAIV